MNYRLLRVIVIQIAEAAAAGVISAYLVRKRNRFAFDGDKKIYGPIINPWILPVCMVLYVLDLVLHSGFNSLADNAPYVFINYTFMITAYFVFLTAAMPLLRNIIQSRTLAVLWLVPGVEFCALTFFRMPLIPIEISLSKPVVSTLTFIWIGGVAVSLTVDIVTHFSFRKKISSQSASEISSEDLSTFNSVKKWLDLPEDGIKLIRSYAVDCPLSIGIFYKTTLVILPAETVYEPDELELILKHELIHVKRRDCVTKFYMSVCRALCWFNPLAIVGIRKCAEDLELSCDELTLLFDKGKRRQDYAKLIIRTNKNSRGYTSCLSEKGKSVLYRLEKIMSLKTMKNGSVILGTAVAIMILTGGMLTITFKGNIPIRELMGEEQEVNTYELKRAEIITNNQWNEFDTAKWAPEDREKIKEFVYGIEVREISADYLYRIDNQWDVVLNFGDDEHYTEIVISDSIVQVCREKDRDVTCYLLPGASESNKLATIKQYVERAYMNNK